ncbi:hypothetical protein MTR_5g020087 [Medicago truncatula]|uniref:Uncharacterized protein n=1 Tax=Medicago truncatula TaxID=3880 RepID=A0A072UCN8_MEDTR|nr:hypothetical protein MTR_5g020087 [Medicago truncatula]
MQRTPIWVSTKVSSSYYGYKSSSTFRIKGPWSSIIEAATRWYGRKHELMNVVTRQMATIYNPII